MGNRKVSKRSNHGQGEGHGKVQGRKGSKGLSRSMGSNSGKPGGEGPVLPEGVAGLAGLPGKSPEAGERARPQTLYMVATPIGNLRDITLRALDILTSVDVIACESLMRSRNLLREYRIYPEQLLVCQAGNEEAGAGGLVKLLERGRSIAYISDAGTPGINDPGMKLVAAVRGEGFAVEALPGPSALTMMASLASCSCKPLSFVGFLSPKSGRRQRELRHWLEQGHSFVFYESPFRVEATLKDIDCLAPQRVLFLGREMTKKNAQFLWGTSDHLLCQLKLMTLVRGEFTLLVAEE
ncbi:16S rRNA (cytidine(1402)-2'-O)-methyltransferase [Candidatus Haliotispira prima]|uniref:Ribosomal RNA small subunit methyltransferase I n=1 Tax=Candidatus Haliotispira prima TaxID=3034016 RepID=A0ABY8MDU5_9SPIO|nr:16S rRNA (cytidine(1402)-2'-O)-methyltransferase [Candidatus Haliotispira prima]